MNRAKEVKCMKKSDLVAGKHVVKYRDGKFRFVGEYGILLDSEGSGVHTLSSYDESLLSNNGAKPLDIVAVYELKEVWKREEPTITEDEKTILRNLSEKYEWIARDESGVLYIYHDKPKKNSFAWAVGFGSRCLSLFDHLFQMIRWEDDEPWKIEDLLNMDVKEDK